MWRVHPVRRDFSKALGDTGYSRGPATVARVTFGDGHAQVGSPLLELALFRNALFTQGVCVLLLETALGSGLFFVLALYLQSGYHFSPFEAGLAFTPMAITYTVGSLLTARLRRLLGTRILSVGILIASLGTLWTFAVVTGADSTLTIIALLPLAVMGFGNALVATPLPGFIVAVAGDDAAGAASGAISTPSS